MNKVHTATLTFSSVEGSPNFEMTVEWGEPLFETIKAVGGEENLPASHKMMIHIVDRIIRLNSAFNEDGSMTIIEDTSADENPAIRH